MYAHPSPTPPPNPLLVLGVVAVIVAYIGYRIYCAILKQMAINAKISALSRTKLPSGQAENIGEASGDESGHAGDRDRIRRTEVPQPMRAAIAAVFLLTCFASLNAQEQTGTIVFYREPHALTGDFKPMLYCDSKELARIENGTSFEVTAPLGIHTCTVESLQRPGAIEINVTEGKSAYVHVKLVQGWGNHAALANTTESEYTKEASRLKPLKEWSRNSLSLSQVEGAEVSQGTSISDRDAESTNGVARVFLTRRKSWLASGGFTPNGRAGNSQGPDYSKDFHKRCPNLLITDRQDTADYAVTVDEIGLLDSLTGPSDKPTFQVAVYSRSGGLLYTGGTSFLGNALKDACNAIGAR